MYGSAFFTSKALSVHTGSNKVYNIFRYHQKNNCMTKITLFALVVLFIGCNTDDKAIDQVTQGIEYGAIIRTLSFNNSDFTIDDLNSLFSVNIEEQDKENGNLLQEIDIFASFKDNTLTGANLSTSEVKVRTLTLDDFTPGGADGLPRMTLEFSYSQLLTATGISQAQVACKDQFLLRLVVKLTNGLELTVGNASSNILAFNTFFSSPYCYIINIVEPIDQELFTGFYTYSSVEDGPFGPTFGPPSVVQITKGHSNTTRVVPLKHTLSHPTNELPREYEFSIVCDESVFGKNQLSSVIGSCRPLGDAVLLGPGDENATINPNDDSVFEVWFVEGYEGWDGGCGFGTAPSKIRFTKQ